MTTREKYIRAGIIRPVVVETQSGYVYRRGSWDTPLRAKLIEDGKVRPLGLFMEPNAPMAKVMREFLIRVTGR